MFLYLYPQCKNNYCTLLTRHRLYFEGIGTPVFPVNLNKTAWIYQHIICFIQKLLLFLFIYTLHTVLGTVRNIKSNLKLLIPHACTNLCLTFWSKLISETDSYPIDWIPFLYDLLNCCFLPSLVTSSHPPSLSITPECNPAPHTLDCCKNMNGNA